MAIISPSAERSSSPISTQAPVQGTQVPATPSIRKQTDIGEASVPREETVPVKEEDKISPKFAALARKERALREQARALQSERELLKAIQAENETMKAWRGKLSTDPLSVLTEAGVSYDQLTQSLLNSNQTVDPEIVKLKQELQAIKSAQAKTETSISDAQKQQYEQAKTQIKREVTLLIDGNDDFETIKSMQAEDAVVDLIEEHFKQQGVLMSIDEASKEVEEFLLEEALRIARLKKVQSKLTPALAASVTEKQVAPPQKKPPLTLSNRQAPQATQPLTAKERRARAIAAFRGETLN
jgi:hypothetical protein